jgi:single-strand DNA-binding protein
MVDLNHVILIGRLTRDAELKYTTNGQAVCKFAIAVNRRKKNGEQWEDVANFFDIVVWGKQGESLKQYLVKGKMVGVDGELRQDSWEQDGQKRSRVEIVANNLQLLGGTPGSGGGGAYPGAYGDGGGYGGSSSPERQSPGSAQAADSGSGGRAGGGSDSRADDFADDIPF